jgi:hypothetical protein
MIRAQKDIRRPVEMFLVFWYVVNAVGGGYKEPLSGTWQR